MTSLMLYDFELDENCYKARLLLTALGTSFRKVDIDMVPGAEQTRPPLHDLLASASPPHGPAWLPGCSTVPSLLLD